jgi:hypothetical protein
MVIKLDVEIWETGQGGTKRGWEKWWVSGVRGMGAAGFCSPCVYLAVFLLL